MAFPCKEPSFLRGFLVLSAVFSHSFEVAAAETSYALAEKVDVLESPVAVEWRGVVLYEYLQGIEMISDDGEEINFYAPVGELASALDMKITSSSSGEVGGWIGEPDNSWYVSLDYVSNKDKGFPVENGGVVSWEGELFASVDLLGKAFGFSMNLNESERVITVGSNANIPVLMALKRKENRNLMLWNKANMEADAEKNKLVPFHVDPYAIVSVPTVDASLSMGQNNAKSSTSMSYYLTISNQMLYMNSKISLSGSVIESSKVKPSLVFNSFSLDRSLTTKQGDTIKLALGDVSFGGPGSPVSTVGGGRGISVYKDYAGEDDSSMETSPDFLYEGTGAPGNDVEVYRGESDLIYSTVIPDSGKYRIPKQTLFAGVNTFYIREYDAGGLVNQIVIRRSLSRAQIPAGKSSWGIALLQPTRDMRDIIIKENKKSTQEDDDRAGVSFVYSLGVTDNFTNTFGYSYIPIKQNGKETYTQVFGNMGTFSLGAGSLSLTVDTYLTGSHNAITGSGSYSRPIGDDVSFSVSHTSYMNKDAEYLFKKKGSTSASMSFSFPDFHSSSIAYSASLDSFAYTTLLERKLGGKYNLKLSTFGGIRLGKIGISSSFDATLPQGSISKATYAGSVSGYVTPKGMIANAQISYGKKPSKDWKVKSYGLRVSSIDLTKKWGISTKLSYDTNDKAMAASLGFSRNFSEVRLSSSLQLKTDKSYSFGISLGTSLSYIPDRGFVMSGSGAPNRVIVPEYFMDSNNNGVMDKNEKPIEGINTLISGTSFASDQASDASGRGFLMRRMQTGTPFSVAVDRGSLRDPFLKSSIKGYQVNSPAPSGKELVIPMPMVRVSDVEAYIFEKQGISEKPISRMIFELYYKGERINKMRSMSGGELYFENLVPGEYTLKAAENQFGAASEYTVEDTIFTVSGEEVQIKEIRVQAKKKPSN